MEYLISLIKIIIPFTLGAYLMGYYTRKGQNLASKQDLEELTTVVESIKNELKVRSQLSENVMGAKLNVYNTILTYINKMRSEHGSIIVAQGLENFTLNEKLYKPLKSEINELRKYRDENNLYINKKVHDALIEIDIYLYLLDPTMTVSRFIVGFNKKMNKLTRAISEDLNEGSFRVEIPELREDYKF